MSPLAHIGNIPVEEWLPFLVPLIALYVYGRRWGRRRRAALARLPGPTAPIDERTIELILARWAASDHGEVMREQVPLLYPPGPDGVTATELADRLGSDRTSVTRRLEDLADLGYLDFEGRPDVDEPRAWLTPRGYDLAHLTEDVLLASADDAADRSHEVPSAG